MVAALSACDSAWWQRLASAGASGGNRAGDHDGGGCAGAGTGAAGSGTLWLSTAQLEFTFGRFAEVVQGRPAGLAGLAGLPTDGEFAARLLILRELSHHLGFDGIHLLPL